MNVYYRLGHLVAKIQYQIQIKYLHQLMAQLNVSIVVTERITPVSREPLLILY